MEGRGGGGGCGGEVEGWGRLRGGGEDRWKGREGKGREVEGGCGDRKPIGRVRWCLTKVI